MNIKKLVQVSCIAMATICSSFAEADFDYRVYDGSFDVLPDFSTLTPIKEGQSPTIDLTVTTQVDTFALVFTQQITVSAEGEYIFSTTSDDGSKLYIDDTVVVDNDGLHGAVTVNDSIFLVPGVYDLRVEFFERTGGESLNVAYRTGNGEFEPIPSDGVLSFIAVDRAAIGEWSSVIQWPHIAISAANLPDGRIVTWSSTETNAFPSNREFTHSAVFNPINNTFENTDSNFHDMFCAGVSTLEDGRIVAAGGNPQDRRTSAFNPDTLSWSPLSSMIDQRWYATSITLPNDEVFATFGKSAGNRSEKYDPVLDRWTSTPNANLQTLLTEQNNIGGLEWFPLLAIQPNGRVFHGWPTPTFHTFDPAGGAANIDHGQPTGQRPRKWSNIATYDVGKVIMMGGADLNANPQTLRTNVYLVDLNGPAPAITQGPPMNFARSLSNTVTLPNGEVLIIGGNTTGQNFSDVGSVLPAEIYNPVTNTWRVVDSISIPRNYHSTALLMKDGRVLSAGGGACGNGCAANHLDGQIFSPPYLFSADGAPATRPVLTEVPAQTEASNSFTVTASAGTEKFSMVRLSATTHHVNTDQRFVPVTSVNNGDGTHTLTMNANPNVLIAGNYWLFAINADGTPSIGETIQIVRPSPDTDNDGVSDINDAFPNDATETTDSDGDGVGDNADVFPNDASETTDTDGDGVGDNADVAPNDPAVSYRSGIQRQWWFNISGNDIATMTNLPTYPNTPAGSEELALFEGPTNWGSNYGSRINGVLYAPTTGNYTFWIAGDDSSELWLSTNGTEANKRLIAQVPGWSNSRQWNKFPQQQSVSIRLQAGQAYYIESLQKEGGGGDNIAVAWQQPGNANIEVLSEQYFTAPIDPTLDSDGDGVPDVNDAFPNDASETADTDGDGVGNNADAFPNDATETLDSDGDGVGDNADAFPNDPTRTENDPACRVIDFNQNAVLSFAGAQDNGSSQLVNAGTGVQLLNNAWKAINLQSAYNITEDTVLEFDFLSTSEGEEHSIGFSNNINQVNDGTRFKLFGTQNTTSYAVQDFNDYQNLGEVKRYAIPVGQYFTGGFDLLTFTADSDRTPSIGESIFSNISLKGSGCSVVDPTLDSDGDGVPDINDAFPNDASETVDTDGDGVGDNADVFPNDASETADTDGDGVGNNADVFPNDASETVDTDGDGLGDNADAFPNDSNETTDTDGDGVGDNSDVFPNDPTRFEFSAITELPSFPRNSSTLIVESSTGADRIWNVNPDNNSVSVSSSDGDLLQQITVGETPWSLAKSTSTDQVYVTNKGAATISIINSQTLTVEQTINLPANSQPHGIVFDASGTHYYVVLEVLAALEKRLVSNNNLVAALSLSGTPRHLSIAFDDSQLYVSNFITPLAPGEDSVIVDTTNALAEVFSIDVSTFSLTNTIGLTHDDRPLSESQGPGMPNYLSAPVVSFDNAYAYVPSKKDNIDAGTLRGKFGITFDSTVRANTSRINLVTASEDNVFRIDHDNSSVATHAALTGDNRYLLVALETSRELVVYDTQNGFQVMRLPTGRAPQSVALSSDGSQAYVHNFMDRTISHFDLTEMLRTDLPATNVLPSIQVVSNEQLTPEVLLGKQHFYDAADDRLAFDNYLSCASCHKEGKHDGRVWDFGRFGEGLRNTTSLLGKGGLAQGLLHWSGNFDEVQDFEAQIRSLAGGTGLMSNADFNSGTVNQPLGEIKTGLSADLDALAAYLESLNKPVLSPLHSNSGLSTEAQQGQQLFVDKACASCHNGNEFTDSGSEIRHDIGTLTAASGQRLSGTLDGLDTPTLLGLWTSAPYLHDGSAVTVAQAIMSHSSLVVSASEAASITRFLHELPVNPLLDSDGDGVSDVDDAFPDDASETTDTDGDGVGDNADAFPNDASEIADSDGDGVGDNTDAFPSDASETADTDGDGVGNNTDAFPNDSSETVDTDNDGVGDNADVFPSDASETVDTDGDGVGNNADAFPNDSNETLDSDGDGVGDNADPTPFGEEQEVLVRAASEASLSGSFVLAGNGQYIEVPENVGDQYTFNNNLSRADFSFTVKTAGSYRLVGDTLSPNGTSDSFFVSVNGQPSTPYLWDTTNSNSFISGYVINRGSSAPVAVNLAEGEHTVSIYHREDGTLLSQLSLELVPVPSAGLTVEAETATLFGNMQVSANGQFISVPNGLGNAYSFNTSSRAEFSFTVTTAGNYKIEASVRSPNGGSDSFFVRVNGSPSTPYIWDTTRTSSFVTDFVSNRGTGDVSVFLTAGTHTVIVYHREDGTELDRLSLVRQ